MEEGTFGFGCFAAGFDPFRIHSMPDDDIWTVRGTRPVDIGHIILRHLVGEEHPIQLSCSFQGSPWSFQ